MKTEDVSRKHVDNAEVLEEMARMEKRHIEAIRAAKSNFAQIIEKNQNDVRVLRQIVWALIAWTVFRLLW